MDGITIEAQKASLDSKVQRLRELLAGTKEELGTLTEEVILGSDAQPEPHINTPSASENHETDMKHFGKRINNNELKEYKGSLSKEERQEVRRLKREINKELRQIRELDPQFSLDINSGTAIITVEKPGGNAAARKLANRLENEKKDLITQRRELKSATGSAAMIAAINDEIDRRTKTIAQLHTGDWKNLQGYERDPELQRFFNEYCGPQQGKEQLSGNNNQKNIPCPPVEGLLGKVDGLDEAQKRRGGNLAMLAGMGVTIYGLYQVLFGKNKKAGYTILGSIAGLSALNYFFNGRMMGLTGLFKGLAIGGRAGEDLDQMLEKLGIDSNLSSCVTTAPEGTEAATIPAVTIGSVIPPNETYKSFRDKYLELNSNNEFALKKTANGGTVLGAYWASQGNTAKEQMTASLANDGGGINLVDQALSRAQIKDNLINNEDKSIDLTQINILNKKIEDYLTTHKLKIIDPVAVDKYYSGEYTWNELLAQEGVFETTEKATVLTDIPRYDVDHVNALLRAPQNASAIMGLTVGNVLAYATPQTLGYDINRAAIANNTTDPLMKGQLDNSTSAQKIERSLLVNELIGMTGQDPDTLKNSTQTFRELFDTNKVGLQHIAYAYEQLNKQNLMIDPLKLREFHQALMTTPDTAGVDTLITTWVSAGDIDFDIDSNPLLSDVKTNELQAQLEQRKTSPLSLEKKSEIAARYLHLNQELQNKLPSPMTVELSDTGNVIIKSYGQETTFDASQDIGSGVSLTHQPITYDKKANGESSTLPLRPTSIAEAMNIAQLTNFTTGVMRYGGADVSPWEWQNNKLQFSQQDSFLEYGKDVWRSGFDLKTLKSYVDTDVTSKDAVTTLYPMLQKPGQGEAYARWLNERNIWHRESNPEKIKELRNTVDQTLVTINNGLPASEQFYIDTDKSHGHIVTINRKNSGIKEGIQIDMMDNQVLGGLSPLVIPGSLESATRLATQLLIAGEYMAYLYGKGKDLSSEIKKKIESWKQSSPLFKSIMELIANFQKLGSNLVGLAGYIVKGLAALVGLPAYIFGGEMVDDVKTVRDSQANTNTLDSQANNNTADSQANNNTADSQAH